VEEGLKKGREEGRKEERKKVIRHRAAKGMTAKDIADLTGLTGEGVGKWVE
jgi:predicted transposase/invertase (TIGR01784 family)